MASYPTLSGGAGISGLLRAIQEQKQTSPLSVPPSAEPGSPIRDLTQTPLMQAENPQSSRVIAARPELQGQQPGGSLNVVAPTLPVAPAVAPVAPVAPTPAPTPAAPAQSQAPTPAPAANPSISSNAGARAAGQAVLGASIGRPTLSTKILPVATVKSAPAKPSPTPTPAPQRAPSMSRIGGSPALSTGAAAEGLGLDGLLGLGTKLAPSILSKLFGVLGGEQLASKLAGTSIFNPKKAY